MRAVIVVSEATAAEVQGQILGCERCAGPEAEFPLSWLLDSATGRDPARTDYILSEPMKCPRCSGEITEETLVEWD